MSTPSWISAKLYFERPLSNSPWPQPSVSARLTRVRRANFLGQYCSRKYWYRSFVGSPVARMFILSRTIGCCSHRNHSAARQVPSVLPHNFFTLVISTSFIEEPTLVEPIRESQRLYNPRP